MLVVIWYLTTFIYFSTTWIARSRKLPTFRYIKNRNAQILVVISLLQHSLPVVIYYFSCSTPHETQIQDLTAHLDANFLKDSSFYILSCFYKFELAESKTWESQIEGNIILVYFPLSYRKHCLRNLLCLTDFMVYLSWYIN